MDNSDNKIHILLCIDNQSSRAHLGSELANLDYEPIYASNGTECREIARRLQPNIILFDESIRMSSGSDIVEKIKTEELTKAIPLILLTNTNQVETEKDSIIVDGRFSKNENFTVIAKGIKRILELSSKPIAQV